ncbi:uncharacterized protein LOC117591180 [Drosophila guanche]|uniref:Blast:Zinc finger protein 358 n=1 Tax=Drosophila guanche TaxID=7266 RepID=A0A3B0K683_DROGU|nr:uncharacterized protein LOC117591180 [Drosophila guanche]SPP89645.1 blast:Zinc finger protein 358 [Drosophila guanche]
MRQICGTVYTWNCAGELYAIECAICEERPLCTLSEFTSHMEIWHSGWGGEAAETSTDDEATAYADSGVPAASVDELMQEVLAEQRTSEADNELKQQLVQKLNATDQPVVEAAVEPVVVSEQVKFAFENPAPAPVPEGHRLTTQHVNQLIELYRAEPRLWNQSHSQFHDTDLCRKSWRRITDAWSVHCGRRFTVTDVRIRVSTLCQRFIKQRERLEADGELDEAVKFVHYDQLGFLCEQQALLKRQQHFVRENRKLIELYEHYPIFWHNAHKRLRCADIVRGRHEALRDLQLALRLSGINLSSLVIKRRLQSLRKRYRLEKIRYLHCVVEGKQSEFVAGFEHYEEMEFLHKHIDPYVCAVCGKIFENLASHQAHVQSNCHIQMGMDFGSEKEAAEGENEKVEQSEPVQGREQDVDFHILQDLQHEEYPRQVEQNFPQAENLLPVEDLLPTKNMQQPPVTPQVQENKDILKLENIPQMIELVGNLREAQADESTSIEEETVCSTPDREQERIIISSLSETCSASELEALPSVAPSELEQKENSAVRMSRQQALKLIKLYRANVCLWDPNHLDYHTRKHRRLAWQRVTDELNRSECTGPGQRYSWQMLHRKITDYTKYYRRERQRDQETKLGEETTRWNFYEEFRFLNDVLPISSEIQKTLSQRDSTLKIIAVYQSYAQLWCTDHPDYTKRRQRQRQLESLCTRLQEESNLQITVERLKGRLIEFRCHYRQCKEARIAALKKAETWNPEYEYYEQLRFLELHVSPFVCPRCTASFKRRTDFLQHERNVHVDQEKALNGEYGFVRRRRRRTDKDSPNDLANVCHICGLKFSLRNSLLAHLRRHLGQRTHICPECPKKFFNSTALRVHQRSHSKELPYVCEHCARGFVNASKLNQHVKRHRNQRDFPCNRCDKAFYTAHERDRHIRAHLNIRDKVCPHCSRAFVVGSAYYSHLNLHRSEKRYSCANCGRRFAQYAGLYKHRRRCVPTNVQAEH